MKSNTFLQNISLTFFSNIISLLVSLIGTFFIPKYTNVTVYGYWQLYLFYISYAGLLHIGLCDGIYLKYGGIQYNKIDKDLLRGQFFTLLIYLMVIIVFVLTICNILTIDPNNIRIIRFTCIGAFLQVLKTYLLLILQSTNRIKEYSFIIICDRMVFVFGIIVILLKKKISYDAIILCDILGRLISLLLTILFTKELVFGKLIRFSIIVKELIINISSGVRLLLSGIASSLIIGVIRYAIKIKQNIIEFGRVSLSLSVINMILSFINMVAIVFFPLLKQIDNKRQCEIYKHAEGILLISTFGVLCFSGVIKYIISLWLPQYADSLNYMIILLPSCVFESETLMLLNTYLKAARKERDLLIVNLGVMLLALTFAVLYYFFNINLIISLIGIDVLLLIRCIILKRLVYNIFDMSGFVDIILSEISLFVLYILLFILFSIRKASIIYAFVFLLFCYINKNTFFKSVRYFIKQKNK